MPRLLKVFASLLFALILIFSLGSRVLAAKLLPALTAPEMNLEKYVIGEDSINPDGSAGMLTALINGVILLSLGSRDENGNVVVQGATDHVANFASVMYQAPPASSIQYFAYIKQKLNIVPQAYAQGKGAEFLNPIVNLWTIMRNAIYVFYIVIFVALGFMIMFRAKLNPQTVIGISSALPNIIVSLILVTFSFAICGFIIDLAYLGNGLIYSLFYGAFEVPSAPGSPATISQWLISADPITVIGQADFGGNLYRALTGIAVILTGGDLGSGGAILIFNLVVAMTIISTAFKIFFNLLTKYISMFLIAILSPLAIFAAGFAGVGAATNFFKQLIAAALVFPATYFLVNLSFYFSTYVRNGGDGFVDLIPFNISTLLTVGGSSAAAAAGTDPITTQTIASLLALGVLMAATQIPQVIEGALNVKPTIGAATGEQLGGAVRKIPLIGGLMG